MALLKSFFKGKQKKESLAEAAYEAISIETLKRLIPIRTLSEDKLQSFAFGTKAKKIPAGKIIFTQNEVARSTIYLLKGCVILSDRNGVSYEVDATEDKAKFPISSGIKHTTTATAKSNISILQVSQKIMTANADEKLFTELTIPAHLNDNRLLQMFVQHFLSDELEVPSLPGIAIQLRSAMKKEIGIDEAVKIIQLDPIISAKLIEVANCPLYVSSLPAKSCFDAVNRMGLNATRNLVISLSIKNIFNTDSPKIKKKLDALWKNSLYLSTISFVLASISKQVNPEEALLAGLICDIGSIPFLNFVAHLPSDFYDDEEIEQALPVVKGVVGASILQKWGFVDEFIQVNLLSDNWYQQSDGELTYTDIVVLSRLHSRIGKKMAHLPAMTSIPAASKLKNLALSPENSLQILHDAKNKINDALKTFSI